MPSTPKPMPLRPVTTLLAMPLLCLLLVAAGCAAEQPTPPADAAEAPATTAPAATTEPDHQALQRQTLSTMRDVGVAMMGWLTDEVGAGAAGMTVTVGDWPETDLADLEAALVPVYLDELPRNDAWGHPFDYRVRLDDPMAERVMWIRSAGSDGRFDGETYETGPFDPALTGHDVVWTDGAFMVWPEKTE